MNRGASWGMVLAILFGGTGMAANARAYDAITWHSIDGGGIAFASAGGYRLGGTIGQPDAGTLGAGALALHGGFWSGGRAATTAVSGGSASTLPFRFYPARPNPIQSSGRLVFDLPRESPVALSVFDLSGRVVHRVDYGRLPAGRQERTWNAADRSGRPLASGVYFIRLEAGQDHGVRRVLVVR